MTSSTEMQLLALHRAPALRLEAISEHYLQLSWPEAKRRAALNLLPFPTFRLTESQKAPIMVTVKDLATHIDATHETAAAEWEKSQV